MSEERPVSEIEEQQLRLVRAYQVIFGQSGLRTPQQVAVLEDLALKGYRDRPTFIGLAGLPLDPLRAAVAEGHRMFYLHIMAQLAKSPNELSPGPTVIK